MRIITLQQRTQEWLAWRKDGIGASDAPAILGRSLWTTPQELWELKKGLREPPQVNAFMQRGIDYEDEARAYFESMMGEMFTPMCAEHDEASFIRASYDGLDISLTVGLEIKIPGEKGHKAAMEGVVPHYYEPQIQHQYLVGVEKMYYGSYSPETKTGVLLEVPRNQQLIDELWEAEHDFWRHLQDGTPMYTPEWAEAAAIWLAAESDYQYAKQAKEAAVRRLRAVHPEGMGSFKAAGVTASVWRKVQDTNWEDLVKYLQSKGHNVSMSDIDAFRPKLLGSVDEEALLRHFRMNERELEAFRVYSSEIYTVKRANGGSR